jgi:lysophospholipase L1-like esterase
MCGCASELGKQLGLEYEITGTIMPGSRLQNITKLAKNEIAGLSNGDAVIILGGSNDVNWNETMKGLKYLNDFVNQRSNTNIMIVTAPHRHDLLITSCINMKCTFSTGNYIKS